LENLIDAEISDYYQYEITETKEERILKYDEMLKGILEDIQNETSKAVISAKFHNTIIKATAELLCSIREQLGLTDVVLSGGVFENSYLLEGLSKELKRLHFHVYYNLQTPSNDEGISFGQAVAAQAIIKERAYVSCNSGESDTNQ
jgi:hydrogenase maturation protein HypF